MRHKGTELASPSIIPSVAPRNGVILPWHSVLALLNAYALSSYWKEMF